MPKKGNQGDGGGRPPVVFSPEEIAQVETLSAVMSKYQIADFFNISPTTLREVENRQKEVSDSYKRGKAKAIGAIGQSLLKQAREGNLGAQIFYLKTQAGWKETEKREISGADGGPIDTVWTINVVGE
jgi:hypothetical protein|tara:strand:+ start:154 stop:537 length:384 start_codon:yes stop_codon:yes gene_type:complete